MIYDHCLINFNAVMHMWPSCLRFSFFPMIGTTLNFTGSWPEVKVEDEMTNKTIFDIV